MKLRAHRRPSRSPRLLTLLAAATVAVGLLLPGRVWATATPNSWICSVGDSNPGCTSSSILPMPTGNYAFAVASAGGKIYLFGGASTGSFPFVRNIVEVYDPGSNSWSCSIGDTNPGCTLPSTITPMPTARVDAVAVAEGGLIYVMGGAGVIGGQLKDLTIVEAYDPMNNVWACSTDDTNCPVASRTLAPMLQAQRYAVGSLGPAGKIYVPGGSRPSGDDSYDEVYDPGHNVWTAFTPLPTGREAAVGSFGSDGRLYVIGGAGSSGITTVVEAYDPTSGKWFCSIRDAAPSCSSHTLAPAPTARAEAAGVVGADGRIEVIGGRDQSSTDLNIVEAYDVTANQWECSTNDTAPGCATSDIVPMPTVRADLGAAMGSDSRTYALGGYFNLRTVEAYAPCTERPTITLARIVSVPNKQAQITVQDATSGITSIVVTQSQNLDVVVPKFTPGTTSPITVTATRKDNTAAGVVGLVATNGAGCATPFDPVFLSSVSQPGVPIIQTVTNIQQDEHQVTVVNGTPGLAALFILVNGKTFVVSGLRDGQTRTLDITSGLEAGPNTIKIIGVGQLGATATVLVGS